MSELKLPEASPSWDSVVYVIALIVAAAGVLVALVKGWEAWKKISVRDRVKDLEGRMSKVEARLKLGDKRFDLQNDDMGHLLQIQMTLMMHFVSGNDNEKLKAQITALGDYMAQRATKAAAYAAEHERITNGGNGNV